jgi:hypothetical protein
MQLGENAMAARKAINQAANPLCAWNHRAHRIFGARKAFFPTMISSIRNYVMASNSSPPLIKAASTRHNTNIKHSSTSTPIFTTFTNQLTPNHIHTTQTSCLDQTSATLLCTRRTSSALSLTRHSRRRRRRTDSTRARRTLTRLPTPVRCPLPPLHLSPVLAYSTTCLEKSVLLTNIQRMSARSRTS